MNDPTPGFEAHALDVVRAVFTEVGRVSPLLFIHRKGEDVEIAQPTFGPGSIAQKDRAADTIRARLAPLDPEGIAFALEVWIADGPDPRPPAERPDRAEGVIVTVEHHRIHHAAPRQWRALIYRDATGAPTLGPWELFGGELSGRIVGLLPSRGAKA